MIQNQNKTMYGILLKGRFIQVVGTLVILEGKVVEIGVNLQAIMDRNTEIESCLISMKDLRFVDINLVL